MASIKSQILNLLGEDTEYADGITDIYAIIEDGIFKAASVLPKNLLIQGNASGENPQDLPPDTATFTFTENLFEKSGSELSSSDILLLVERIKSSLVFTNVGETDVESESYETRFVEEVNISQKHRVSDTSSIYLATDYSPNFWIEPHASDSDKRIIYTHPVTTPTLKQTGIAEAYLNFLGHNSSALKIWKYTRQEIASDSVLVLTGIPEPAVMFCLKVAALGILDVMIANQMTNEEDNELFQGLSAQKGLLEKDIGEELKMFREVYK